MILQNPLALWLLFLVAIPIAIHLFEFRKIRKILFTNVAFLRSINELNKPNQRLKRRLILLSRILIIVLAVLLFCNPVINDFTRVDTGDYTVRIDNSFSLKSGCDGNCLENALEDFEEIVINEGILNGHYVLNDFNTPRDVDYNDIIDFPREYSKQSFSVNKIGSTQYVLSDFADDVVSVLNEQVNDSSNFILVPVAELPRSNLFCDSVYFEEQTLGSSIFRVKARIQNSGNDEAEDVLVKMMNGDFQIGSQTVSLSGNSTSVIDFEVENSKNNGYRILIEDQITPFDNLYYFNLPNQKKIQVSTISEGQSKYLKALFDEEQLFDSRFFQLSDVDFEFLLSSDLLLLDQVVDMPDWLDIDVFEGDVVIIPPIELNTMEYEEFLGWSLMEVSDTNWQSLKKDEFTNPFFSDIFESISDRVSLPRFKESYRLRSISEPILSGETPLLSRVDNENRSSIYWFSTPLIPEYTDLTNHAVFLPIMYRIAERAVGITDPLAFEMEENPIVFSSDYHIDADLIKLVGNGSEFVPSIYPNNSELILDLPTTLNEPGHYYLVQGQDTLKRIALNYPKIESKLPSLDNSGLKEYFKDYENVEVWGNLENDELGTKLSSMTNGKPLWKYALILILIFLVAETLLHRFAK